MLTEFASAQMAYAQIPRDYPGSQLTSQWQSGGPDTCWERRTYNVTDNVEQVLAYYQEHLPGFTVYGSEQHGTEYINHRCDESWLSRLVARLINEGHYPEYTADNVPLPCVIVSIYQAQANASETQFEIWLSWPAS